MWRVWIATAIVAGGCGASTPSQRTSSSDNHLCKVDSRRVGAVAQGQRKPRIATDGNTYLVAWQDQTGGQSSIRTQLVGADAHLIGDVVTLASSGEVPLTDVFVIGMPAAGYTVFWTVAPLSEGSQLMIRRVDGEGHPAENAVVVLKRPEGRVMAAAPTTNGFVLGWSAEAADRGRIQSVRWFDANGAPTSDVVKLPGETTLNPTLDLKATPGGAWVAFVHEKGTAAHVVVAKVAKDGIKRQVDLGEGIAPALWEDGVVFQRSGDLVFAQLSKQRAVHMTAGQQPAAATHGRGAVLCAIRYVTGSDQLGDQIYCSEVDDGRVTNRRPITSIGAGVKALDVAGTIDGYGVVYQRAVDGGDAIDIVTVRCHL